MYDFREGAKHVLTSLRVLNLFIFAPSAFLNPIFTFVAYSRISEAFTSAVLITVLVSPVVPDRIEQYMTMGAFGGSVLLAEISFQQQKSF